MLAIIIPYYKLTFFEATLQSLASQTDQRFKVYIGNDESPESPSILLEKYKGKFDFEYHRFETNLGGTSLTNQWERCIALSGNEVWIMILGDDDVLGKNVVEEFWKYLPEIEKEEINVVRYATQKTDKGGKTISEIYYHPTIEKATDFLFRDSRSSLSEYVFKRAKVNEIGFRNFPLAWFSDIFAILEFSGFRNIFTINSAIVNIRISKLSISGSDMHNKDKATATFLYYYYLLCNRHKFERFQKKKLYASFNKCYLNDKRNISHLVKILMFYIGNLLMLDLYDFIKSIFQNIKKRNANRIQST
jgi:hypothetical protein